MKILKIITGAALLGGLLAGPLAVTAAEQDHPGDAKGTNVTAKPYPLKTCIVSDEKFGGDMGKPYVFVYQGQELKLCCKDCKKKFDKDPAKYIKKLADAQKAAKDAKQAAPDHDHSSHQH